MRMRATQVAAIVTIGWAGAMNAVSAIVHVPGDAPGIQEGIDAAGQGDTVLVAPGEYAIAEPITFRGKSLTLLADSGPEATAIRMSGLPRDPDRASVVVFEGVEETGAVLEGFTLTGGKGTRVDRPQIGDGMPALGGGILCWGGASAVVRGCNITGNLAVLGGGAYVEGGSALRLEDCRIDRNGKDGAGGIAARDSSFVSLQRCVVERNVGAGVSLLDRSAAELVLCVVRGNAPGGVLAAVDSQAYLEASMLLGNGGAGAAAIDGTVILSNCLVAGNDGGGAFCYDGLVQGTNCTLVANQGGGGTLCFESDGCLTYFTNSIFWRNVPEEAPCGRIAYSLVGQDPLFVRSGSFDFGRTITVQIAGEDHQLPDYLLDEGDYRLEAASPAIDAGIATGISLVDIEGNGRFCGRGVDLGAYERGGCAPQVLFRRGDVLGNGFPNISGAVLVLNHLFLGGGAPSCLRTADANDSGTVDISDPVYLLNFLFLGGPAPAAPFQDCGPDDTADELTCDAFQNC